MAQLATALNVLLLQHCYVLGKTVTVALETALGHSGHAAEHGVEAGLAAQGEPGDPIRLAIAAGALAFEEALDARYASGVHGGPPHNGSALSGLCVNVLNNTAVVQAVNRWEADHGSLPATYGPFSAAVAGLVGPALGADATYAAALAAAMLAMDARYGAGTCDWPIGATGAGFRDGLSLVAKHCAETVVECLERTKGHSGHLVDHAEAAGDVAEADVAGFFAAFELNFFAWADARYHANEE